MKFYQEKKKLVIIGAVVFVLLIIIIAASSGGSSNNYQNVVVTPLSDRERYEIYLRRYNMDVSFEDFMYDEEKRSMKEIDAIFQDMTNLTKDHIDFKIQFGKFIKKVGFKRYESSKTDPYKSMNIRYETPKIEPYVVGSLKSYQDIIKS